MLLTNEQAHPIALLHFLSSKYGVEWMEWSPSVLKQTLLKDFALNIARVNLAKALAAAAVATRDEFWTTWETFHFLCQGLNNNIPNHEDLQEHTVGQMMVAVDIASQIRKELGDLSHVPEFSEEVARYVAAHALNEGVWFLPEPLGFANKYTAKKWYRCRDCGTEGEDIFEDGICDVCVDRFDTNTLGSWTPNPQRVKRGWGKNIEYFEKNPTEKVRERLEKALTTDTTLQENQTDICVAKLLVALQYLNHRRNQRRAA
jgi:hypothetical protein